MLRPNYISDIVTSYPMSDCSDAYDTNVVVTQIIQVLKRRTKNNIAIIFNGDYQPEAETEVLRQLACWLKQNQTLHEELRYRAFYRFDFPAMLKDTKKTNLRLQR